ncbi:MAG: hypothetical protein DYG92_07480 [Leptolyngbya sp. PLA1]|nr:hypothetical protein [Leptolyngbya sp. PLA1]
MKVLLINWSPISAGTALGGGVSGYVQQLALELIDRGHEVAYLSSGQTYVPDRQGRIGPPVARRLDDFAGIQVYEIINSPVVSPGPCQHDSPAAEVSAPELEAEVTRLTGLLAPDVVHLHNIEGLSAGCLARVPVRAPEPGGAAPPGAAVRGALPRAGSATPTVSRGAPDAATQGGAGGAPDAASARAATATDPAARHGRDTGNGSSADRGGGPAAQRAVVRVRSGIAGVGSAGQ